MKRGIMSCWSDLRSELREEGVCYQLPIADDSDDGWRPRDNHTGVNYGLEVARAIDELRKTKLTRDQIDALAHLLVWVAKAARNS